MLHGHGWPNQPSDPASMLRTNRGGVCRRARASCSTSSGARAAARRRSGDYLYRDGNLVNQVNQGLWGLFRVLDAPVQGLPTLGQL